MVTRDIVSRPCEDACATIRTDKRVEGAPVYRCPGCDSEWIELDERTATTNLGAALGGSNDPGSVAVGGAGGDGSSRPPAAREAAPATHPPVVSPTGEPVYPRLLQPVLDARAVRPLAEFYRSLLGLVYRPGDAPHFSGSDEPDWLVLMHHDGTPALALQENDRHVPPTWPNPGVPAQLHLDMTVPDRAALGSVRQRVETLGGQVLLDRTGDEVEPLYVFADLAGHPFCVFVA